MSDQTTEVVEETDIDQVEASEEQLSAEELESISGGGNTAPNGQYWATSHTGGGGAYGE